MARQRSNWEIRGLGDQDGNGQADLLWRNAASGQLYFWSMNGGTPLSEIFAGTVDLAYEIVGTGDFDADGRTGLRRNRAGRCTSTGWTRATW